MEYLFRGRRLLRHGRTLRQHDLPFPFLLGEDSQESIFSAERTAFVLAVDGYMFGQDRYLSAGVKLNMGFASVEHLQRAIGPLQILELPGFVQQFPLRIESEEII